MGEKGAKEEKSPHLHQLYLKIGMKIRNYLINLSLIAIVVIIATAFSKKTYVTMPTANTNLPNILNEYVQVVIEDTGNIGAAGRFSVGTIKGDPETSDDDNKKILYGHPDPWSSWTTVRIDGTDQYFGNGGEWKVSPAKEKEKLIAEYEYDDITVCQELSIENGYTTGREDTCKILYKITNNDNKSHDVGLRIMLDTMLGSNDGAPFYTMDVGEITCDTRWSKDIAQSCQVFDSLTSPTITGLVEFTGLGYNDPDKVILGYWPLAGTWDYPFDEDRSFLDNNGDGVIDGSSPDSDSAVFAYYNPVKISAGRSKTYAIRIGIGELIRMTWGPFVIGIMAPRNFQFKSSGDDYQYLPSPFNVVAFVQNTSNSTVRKAKLEINLHENMKLESGERAVKYIEKKHDTKAIPPDYIATLGWNLENYGRVIGESCYSITISCENVDEDPASLVVPITVEGCANALFGHITDSRGKPASGVVLKAKKDGAVIAKCRSSSRGTYFIGDLDPGVYEITAMSDDYQGCSFVHTVTRDASKSTSANATLNAASDSPSKNLNLLIYPNPAQQEKNISIKFDTPSAGEAKIRIFNSAGRLIDSFVRDVSNGGSQIIRWNTRKCANGVYFCQVRFGSNTETEKFAVLRLER
ncbi:T9SS type A sorting domain-containing protein [Elusimicrobiota bacterium]